MQPRRPQGHLAPPRLTTMWPISPAAPRPSHGLPSRTGRRRPRFPRRRRSASRTRGRRRAGTRLRSRPGRRCRPGPRRRAPSPAARRAGSCPPSRAGCGRWRRRRSSRRRRRASRRRPRPVRSVSTPAAVGRLAHRLRHRVGRRPPGRRWSASAAAPRRAPCPSASTIAVWILVPPRSMPPRSRPPPSLRPRRRAENDSPTVVGPSAECCGR